MPLSGAISPNRSRSQESMGDEERTEMTDKNIARKAYQQALSDLREKFYAEMEPTIKCLIAIRDSSLLCVKCGEKLPATPEKERINACKELKAWLGVARVAEQRIPSTSLSPSTDDHPPAPKLSPEMEKRLAELIK